MAVTMSATITDKGVTATVQALKKGCSGPKIAEIAARSMVYTWLPRVFDQNSYGWKPVERGGTPLRRGQRTASSIRSAFVYSVAGAVASIRNVFRYAHIHNDGATITAKNERTVTQNCTSKKGKKFTRTVTMKVLAFKVGDVWWHAKSVKIPQRRFMYWPPAAKAFVLDRVNFFIKDARKGKPV